jgi:hypothetical protein
MESLEGLWEKFSLSDMEGNTVDLHSTPDQPKTFLAAKFLTRRTLNVEAVARTFKPLWRTDHGFTVRDMNDNRLVFVFEDAADRERVMMGEPWAYDKHLVILKHIEEDEAIEEVAFCETAFWVQLHGLPVRKMTFEVVTAICSSLGKIDHVSEGDANAEGGMAMRVRVIMDITKPLCRGRKIRLEKGKELWISFKYERLPNFCYWCGHVSHSDKDCPYWLRNKDSLRIEEQQFGQWLRASTERPWRKMEVKVEGIVRPPPPKNKTPPHTQPTHHTRPSSTKTPPNTPTVAPSPPPLNPIPTSHTPPQTTTTTLPNPIPPPEIAPTAAHTPIPVDFMTDMEVEENLVSSPYCLTKPNRKENNFESQLRDIDSAIDYTPKQNTCHITTHEGGFDAKISSTPINVDNPPPNHESPAILGDITNITHPNPAGPKTQSTKRSWKKLARAQTNHEPPPHEPMQTKRNFFSLDGHTPHARNPKKQCGVLSELISAEVAGQPRREP